MRMCPSIRAGQKAWLVGDDATRIGAKATDRWAIAALDTLNFVVVSVDNHKVSSLEDQFAKRTTRRH